MKHMSPCQNKTIYQTLPLDNMCCTVGESYKVGDSMTYMDLAIVRLLAPFSFNCHSNNMTD